MRICLISKEYPPDTGWGGIGAYNYQIAHGLQEIGHEVEVVSLMGREAAENHPGGKDSSEATLEDGIPVHRARWKGLLDGLSLVHKTMPYTHYNLETNIALWRKFATVNQQQPFDVVEAPEHLADGLMPAVTKSVPMVIKLHTPQAKLIAERFHNLLPTFDQQFIAMVERVAMLGAEVLMSPSENLADWVARDLNYPRQDIRIVRNPVDANKFSPDGNKALQSDGKLLVLFTGRLEARKGIHYLVKAIPTIIERFKNVKFVAVGADTNTAPGQTSVLAELQSMLSASGCSEYVTFIPQVKLDEMPAYYRSADICVAPSLYDNAPYTCIEAMSCGKAVVGSSAGGMAEYMVPGQHGLIVPPGNETALAESILSLLESDSLRNQLGENARQRVMEHFHRTAIAKQNIELYQKAQERFQVRAKKALYRRGDHQFTADAVDLFTKYDASLYDLLFVHSIKFRLQHWWKKLTSADRAGASGSLVENSTSADGKSRCASA